MKKGLAPKQQAVCMIRNASIWDKNQDPVIFVTGAETGHHLCQGGW